METPFLSDSGTLLGSVRASFRFRFNPKQSPTVREEAVHCCLPGRCVYISWGALHETDPGDDCHGLYFQGHSSKVGTSLQLDEI